MTKQVLTSCWDLISQELINGAIDQWSNDCYRLFIIRGKSKGKGLDTCYSTTYMSQTRDQQRFTISEVPADWMSQCFRSALCSYPLPTLTDNWTHNAASTHHRPHQPH